MAHKVTLEVHKHEHEDIYHDRARIPELFRGGIREGRICKISVAGKSKLLEIRGIVSEGRKIIRLDDVTRNDLGIHYGDTKEFSLRKVWWIGQFWWAWHASDPTPRLGARLGILGLILGVIALVIGVIPLVKGC